MPDRQECRSSHRNTEKNEQINYEQIKIIKHSLDQLYTQIESLTWLQQLLKIKTTLPPLRGWPVSPDFLLRLHKWITKNKPSVIVETGSGATTLVIADALRQNGFGKLYSFEHLKKYADETRQMLLEEYLESWVDLRLSELSPWLGEHINPQNDKKKPRWYSSILSDIYNIDLLIVDGPPKSICEYSRYPALPALYDRLSSRAEIWMDDTIRNEEKEICHHWSKKYDLSLEFVSLEKGLGILKR